MFNVHSDSFKPADISYQLVDHSRGPSARIVSASYSDVLCFSEASCEIIL
jgi:hypothetical protein